MCTLFEKIKYEVKDLVVLLRNIPSLAVTFFVLSVVCMNLLANKELFSTEYLALDCGFTLSWFSFLCMDMICKRFGPKAAMKVSMVALFINLVTCALFSLLSRTPGMWGEFYSYVDSNPEMANVANAALNATFGGSWYVVLGSALAMFTSSGVNSIVNYLIAKSTKTTGFKNFALRSYISTMVAQFVDNFIFAMVVSHVFFGWTMTQVIVCSITGSVMELLCEILISPIGYKMVCSWEKHDVGREYLNMKAAK
ncbi:MAG: VUT family protein [Fibrobacter sp.]|nr:VUT family protein [Fibrobacter sp.]